VSFETNLKSSSSFNMPRALIITIRGTLFTLVNDK
jgi:hypothetical protein